MALIKCSECGHEVSDKASVCPNCGCPIEKGLVCNDCGYSLSPTDKTCPNCGCPSNSLKETKSQHLIKGKALQYLSVFLLLCLFMVGGYYAYNTFLRGEDIVELSPDFIKAIRKYDTLDSFSEGFAMVKKDGVYGFINTKGEEVIPCKYDDAYSFSEGYAVVKKGGKNGFINTNGEEVIPFKYDRADSFSEGFAVIERDEMYGFVNTKGEEMIPCKYDWAVSFSEGFAMIVKDGKYGFINTNGEEIIPCKYDYDEYYYTSFLFKDGLAVARKGSKFGIINTHDEEVVPCKYDYAESFSEGFAVVKKDEKYGFINAKGEEIIPCKYDYASSFSEGLAAVNKDGRYGFININDEEIVPCKYDYDYVAGSGAYIYSEGYAIVKKDDKYGFVNIKGEEVVPCKYTYVYPFSKNGVALIQLDCGDKTIYGYVDKNGNDTFTDKDYEELTAYKEQQLREEELQRQEEEARRIAAMKPDWLYGTWVAEESGYQIEMIITKNNLIQRIGGQTFYNGSYYYDGNDELLYNQTTSGGWNDVWPVDKNRQALMNNGSPMRKMNGGYSSSSYGSTNIDSRIQRLENKVQDDIDELNAMVSSGRMNPATLMYIKQNLPTEISELMEYYSNQGNSAKYNDYAYKRRVVIQVLREIGI